jgi:hypothetical protein
VYQEPIVKLGTVFDCGDEKLTVVKIRRRDVIVRGQRQMHHYTVPVEFSVIEQALTPPAVVGK